MEKPDKKALYLDYIDKLYRRRTDAANAAGLSAWVLASAIAYVVWHLTELVSVISDATVARTLTSIYFHGYFFIIGFVLLIRPYRGIVKPTRHDYRAPGPSWFSMREPVILLLVGAIFPASASSAIDISNTAPLVAVWTTGIYTITLVGLCISAFFIKNPDIETGFPNIVLSVNTPKSTLIIAMTSAGKVATVSLIGTNFYALYVVARALPLDPLLGKTLDFGFSLIALNLLLVMYVRELLSSTNRAAFSRLERDVILYDLPEDAIRRRIENDVLEDVELSVWIAEKQKALQHLGEDVLLLCEQASVLRNNVDSSDATKADRKTTIENFNSDLKGRATRYGTELKKMLEWLKTSRVQSAVLGDPYLKELVDTAAKSLDEMHQNVRRRALTTEADLQALFKEAVKLGGKI